MTDKPQTGWIHGLPITVSPGAADALAGVQLAFQLIQQFTGATPAAPQQFVIPQEPGPEEEPDPIDLHYLNSLSPIARAETLAMYGLKQAEPEQPEVDPTLENVKKILAEAAKAEKGEG